MLKKKILGIILLLILTGLIDSLYLTYKHHNYSPVPCTTSIFIDCGKVLGSKYSEISNIPVALIGSIHYFLFLIFLLLFVYKYNISKYLLIISSTIGLFASLYFMFVQLFILKSICIYCTISALVSFTLFFIITKYFKRERKIIVIRIISIIYQKLLKHIFFLIDAEIIHEFMLSLGGLLGKSRITKSIISFLIKGWHPQLMQNISGINYKSPIGLAAGFDYTASLTQFLPDLGFGFMTVGTITNMPYVGNPKPRLGRLPESRSLLVNKGFKNKGAEFISEKLSQLSYDVPLGISIGVTNSPSLKTQSDAIKDIIRSFEMFESHKIENSYYELNISCPNLIHSSQISFYSPNKLEKLLWEIDKLKLKKPVFVKMPIDRKDKEVLAMLDIITRHHIDGVIFGNLQKNRNDKSLIKFEVDKFQTGNFSGKPTFKRSNELIKLAYRKYGNKLVIIGCGGVFNASDAYKKIKLGASLVQLITGLVFKGPQLIEEINFGLEKLLKNDSYTKISQAIGKDAKD